MHRPNPVRFLYTGKLTSQGSPAGLVAGNQEGSLVGFCFPSDLKDRIGMVKDNFLGQFFDNVIYRSGIK